MSSASGPERREEYLELHRNVWPQVEQTLRDANITNYSIFIVEDILFAYPGVRSR